MLFSTYGISGAVETHVAPTLGEVIVGFPVKILSGDVSDQDPLAA